MSKSKPVSLVHRTIASVLAVWMALPNLVVADGLRQIALAAPDPGTPLPRVTLQLTPPPGATGEVFVIQTSTNLVDWQPLVTTSPEPAPGRVKLLSVGPLPALDPVRFFRAASPAGGPAPTFAAASDDNGRVFVFPYLGNRTFGEAVRLVDASGAIRGVAIADFDRDGLLDIFAAFPSGDALRPSFYRGRADGTFAEPQPLPQANGVSSYTMDMAVGDFDVDGGLDVAVNGNSDTTLLYWGAGDGTFTVTSTRFSPGAGRGMTAGDFDEDGRTDLIRTTYSDGILRWFRSNGDRTFTEGPQVGDPGSDPYGVVAGDFDGDGHLDIIANEGGSGDVSFFQGFGDGTFTNLNLGAALAPLDLDTYAAFDTYDFDGDGPLDIVLATHGGRSAYFVPGLPEGGFDTNRVTLTTGMGSSLGVAAPPLPPRVAIEITPQDPVIALRGEVTFNAVGAGAQAGDTFRWTFGDTGDNPLAWTFTPDLTFYGRTLTHKFEREGRFVTRLWHTDAQARHSTRGTWVTVQGNPPVAVPGGPYVFGETNAQALVWTGTLDAAASTDDFGIVRYEWGFGDGTRGTNNTPTITHSWTNVGPWDVELVVEDAARLRATNYTTVTFVPGAPPVARITGPALVDETAARDGQWTVNFSAADATDDVGIWKYDWQFGDGKTGTGRDVTTRYGAVGTYTVTLTVTDHAGQTHATTHEVTVQANNLPVPAITGPRLLPALVATNGLWYGLWDGRASTDDTGIYRYEWTFGDGGTATGIEVSYQYKSAGTYPLTLKVTDHGNQTATTSISVLVVPGETPVARITAAPLNPEGRQPVAFSGELSTDDRGLTSYRWLFPPRSFDFTGRALDADQWIAAGVTQDDRLTATGNGNWARNYFFSLPTRLLRGGSFEGRVDTPTDTSHAMVGLKNLDIGSGHENTYPYALYFDDGELRAYEYGSNRGKVGEYTKGLSYDFRIESLPGAGANFYVRPSGTGAEFELVYTSSQRTDAAFSFGADVHTGTFGFDDFLVTGTFVSAMTVHAPVYPGGPVTLEVVDHEWQTNTAQVTIQPVVGQPPQAVINGPDSAQAGVVLSFDGYRSSDDHGIASYTWDFGDGTTPGAGPAVNHRYDTPGRYTNTLTVLDFANQAATASLVIDVAAGNAVACVPWRIINGIEQPHETFSGKEVTLKAVARGLPLPFDYIWDFGDGSGTVTNTATTPAAAYALEARHAYAGAEGTPFYATVTVILTNGVTLGDTYPLVLRPKSITTEMNVAIDEGLWFLHKNQSRSELNAQLGAGSWSSKGHSVNLTATAVQAFGINGHQYADDGAQDPYVETVQRGIHFLLGTLVTEVVGPQPYGDPDGNQNGIGLYTNDGQPIYQTGPLMDSLVACTRPELVAPVGPANVRGRALGDIMQDLVDIYCWGQYDDPTVGGGWRYGWNQHPDNSAAQWGAIGLTAAEKYWGSVIPAWVKDRNIVWVQYSKGGSGYGYTGPGDGEATTPSALVQLAFAGLSTTNALWQHGETYLARNWSSLVNGYNLYAHYAIAKALRTAHPQPVDKLTWQDRTWDWFLDPAVGLARFTVDAQRADGAWVSRDGWVNEPFLSTAYSIVILSSSLFQRGPVAVIQFRPNPSAVGYPVTFDARASYHQHPAYQVADFRWDFNAADGFDFDHPDAVGPVVTNSYPALGTNLVTLQVRDNGTPVLTDIASIEVRTTIPPFPPTADAGGPYVVAVGEDLPLNGAGSFDVDEGAGDYLTAWDWEVDFVMPLDFDDDITGAEPVLAGGFATPGQHRLGLRVSDATSLVFPQLGLTNLTADDFTTAYVYERVVADLRTRAKENKIQLVWTPVGDYVAVLRSTTSPTRGFTEIGRTDSTYATFLDTNVELNVEYFYRLVVYAHSRPEPLGVSDARLAVSRPRDADNRPPAFLDTPPRIARVGEPYEFALEAADPENDPMTFALLAGPTNFTVEATSGIVRFTPTEDQLGAQAISLEVRNDAGRDVLSFDIVVFPAQNAAPVAAANGPYTSLTGQAVQFSSAGTLDPDGQPLRLFWNFGDGNTSTNPNPSHVYSAPGRYLASLFVNDGYGGTASARANVEVSRPNRPPTVALAGAPSYTVRLGEPLSLDASASADLDGDPLTFTWFWDDGQTSTGPAPQTSHTYAAQGEFLAQLIVADDRGGSATLDFTVAVGPANQPPVIDWSISDIAPLALDEVLFDATATTDPENDPLTFEWDFGDRTRTTGPLVTHVFRDVATNSVTLTVSDGRGGRTTRTTTLEARNAPAGFTSQPPLLVRAGQPYSYMPVATDRNGDALRFELAQGPTTMAVDPATGTLDWLPGDADVGPHPVVLRVTDARGDAAEQSFTLVVTTPAGSEVDLEPVAIVMTNVTVDPQTLALGGTVRVELRNNGADEVPVPFTVSVLVDADADGAYAPGQDRIVAFGTVPAGLRQGFVAWIEMGLTGQALFAGAPLSAFVDSENVVPEYDENNNLRRAGFNLPTNVPPVVDLTASFLQVDRSGLPDQAALTARLGNAGLVAVPAGAPLAFYRGDPQAGGALIGVVLSTQPLAPGTFQDLRVEWLAPTIAAHTVFVVADDQGDGTGLYAEISEANNRFSAPADLTANEPPLADAGPDQRVALGDYAVFNGRGSRDPEGKPLSYQWALRSFPMGSRARLNAADTEQAWLQTDVAGEYVVELVVHDGVHASTADTAAVLAEDPTANRPPDITSTPAFQGMTTVLYEYALQAADPDGDPLTYRLGQAPAGMTIDRNTGLLRWTPAATGTVFVQAIVEDPRGAGRSQSWSITILTYANLPPAFTSTPPFTASPGVPYAYTVTASDPNHDPITFALTEGPDGLSLNASSGLVSWTPTAAQFGSHPVTLTASDNQGGTATQTFNVVVFDAATDGPVVQPIPDQTVIAPAAFTAIPLDPYVFDPTDPDADLTWTVSGATALSVTIDDNRVATITYPPGTLTTERLTFLATDPTGKSGFAAADFTVRSSDQPPVAAFANLSATEATLIETGFFALDGTADDPDAIDPVAYRLTLFDADGARVADVTPPPVNAAGWHQGRVPAGGSLGTLDLTLVRNGSYTLQLEVRGGNLTAYATAPITLNSGLKIGHFTFSQQDAVVPVGGVAIGIVRTYDSLNPAAGDFGYSWTYSVTDLGVVIDEQRARVQDLFGDFFSLRTGGGRDITLDMPDTGRRVTFSFSMVPHGMFRLRAVWTPPPGVNATLVPTVSPNLVSLWNLQYWEAAPIETGLDGFDFPGFILTLQDGTQYRIDREYEGSHFIASDSAIGSYVDAYGKPYLSRITGPAGERTQLVREGTLLKSIDQYDPQGAKLKSIVFQRDAQQRITAVYTPENLDAAGNPTGPATVTYAYDAAGNLIKASVLSDARDPQQPVYATTTYVYGHRRFPHYITEIQDPRGAGARMEYDAQGRLVATIDAQGRRTEIQHDLGAATDTVYDRLGNPTVLAYDERGNVVAKVDALGGVTRTLYDAQDNPLVEIDPLGHTNQFTYSSAGYVLSTTDPLGHVTRLSYDASGQVLTTTDPLGHVTQFEYDERGNVTAVTDAEGHVTRRTYDAANHLITITDPAGHVTHFTYDDAGHLVAQTDPLGHVTRFTYDAAGNRTSESTVVTLLSGALRTNTLTTVYDAANRPVAVTDAAGNTTFTEYDPLGQIVATLDARGQRTEYVYDLLGNRTETRYPDGTSSRALYDAASRLIAETDRENRTTYYEYDALGRRTAIVYPEDADGNHPTLRFEYDAAGRQTAVIDEQGHRTSYGYDAAGRQVAITNALGHVTRLEYDPAGRPVSETDPLGRTTLYLYNKVGRPTRTVFPDGSSRRAEYDALGRVAASIDEAGATTRFEYDALGQLTNVIDALGQSTGYAYNEAGQPVLQRDANGHETRFDPETCCERSSVVLPLGQRLTMSYTAGLLTAVTNYNGQVIRYEYDVNERLSAKRFPDGSAVQFTYSPMGRLQSARDSRGLTRFEYDGRDRLVRQIEPNGQTINYAYDAAGRRTQIVTEGPQAAAPSVTAYTYDAVGRLVTVTDPDGGLTRHHYDAAGNLLLQELPNGLVRSNTFNLRNQLTAVEHRHGSEIVAGFHYTLGPIGHRLGVVEHNGRTVHYEYDALQRLIRESVFNDPSGSNRTNTYTYDPVGNRLAWSLASTLGLEEHRTYTYDPNDQLLAETNVLSGDVTRFTYDANGNTLSRSNALEQATYTWNTDDRLVGARVTDAQGVTRTLGYEYDENGIRVAAHVVEAGQTNTTTYLVDRNQTFAQVLEEWQSLNGQAPTRTAAYTHGQQLISQSRAGVASYYHADALGSTRALTGPAGELTDRYDYDPYGRTLLELGNTPNPYRFAGQQRDAALGLDYLRDRYLSVAHGRFYGRDRADGMRLRPVTLHRYLYAENDPINRYDPSGQISLGELGIVQAISGILRNIQASFNTAYGLCRAKGVIETANTVYMLGGLAFAAYELSDYINAFYGTTLTGSRPSIARGWDLKPILPARMAVLKKIELRLQVSGGPPVTASVGIAINIGVVESRTSYNLITGRVEQQVGGALALPPIKVCGITVAEMSLKIRGSAASGASSGLGIGLRIGIEAKITGNRLISVPIIGPQIL